MCSGTSDAASSRGCANWAGSTAATSRSSIALGQRARQNPTIREGLVASIGCDLQCRGPPLAGARRDRTIPIVFTSCLRSGRRRLCRQPRRPAATVSGSASARRRSPKWLELLKDIASQDQPGHVIMEEDAPLSLDANAVVVPRRLSAVTAVHRFGHEIGDYDREIARRRASRARLVLPSNPILRRQSEMVHGWRRDTACRPSTAIRSTPRPAPSSLTARPGRAGSPGALYRQDPAGARSRRPAGPATDAVRAAVNLKTERRRVTVPPRPRRADEVIE